MNKEKVVKGVLTVVGLLCTVGSTLIDTKKQKNTIREEVAKALAEQAKES